MTQKASAPVFVLIVLLIISLSLTGGGFYLFQKERLKAMDLATKLEEVTEKERITEAKLEESKKVVGDLQVKLQESRDLLERTNAELQQEKATTQEALSKVDQLKSDIQQSDNVKAELEKKLAQAEANAKKAEVKLKDLQGEKDQLETRLKQMSSKPQGVELGNIVVSPESGVSSSAAAPVEVKPAASGLLEGKVLVINKDYNFLVLNLGAKDGIKIGDIFSVYQANKYIGDVKVEKVHESMAAAGFLAEDIKSKIAEGDRVVQKAK